MTGFGVADARAGNGRVVAEVRSVNQRFLEVRAKLPRELADLAMFVEQIARERVKRGRVEIVVHAEGAIFGGAQLDKERAKAAYRELVDLRDQIAPGADVPLSLLSTVPDLFSPPLGRELEALRMSIGDATTRALDAMEAMSVKEGEALRVDLTSRCEVVRALVDEVKLAAARGHDALRRRAKDRIEKMLASADVAADPSRLEAELVLFAERSDVTEELTRLASHLAQMRIAIDAQGPIGRRLDFLLQEMLREANTLGAKAQDAETSQLLVAMKVELERIREQVQNVE